jgi:hypothetical protein
LIDFAAPYIYALGMAGGVLLVGTTAMMCAIAPDDAQRPAGLALTSALFVWGATIYVVLNPLPVAWHHMVSLATWLPLSAISVAEVWYCRPVHDEPPAPPPPMYPKINGKFTTPSEADIAADLLRRTYRKKGA